MEIKYYKNEKRRLVFLSFLMLFVELTLIRWIGSNIYYLFFFSNLILLASFLGMGIGFLRVNSANKLFDFAPLLLALLFVFSYYCSYQYQVKLNPVTDNLDYSGVYFKNNSYPIWITLPFIFIAVTVLMATISHEVARQFQKFAPLEAYRLEIMGSLLGIIIFSMLSFLHTAPLSWAVVICLLFLGLLNRKNFFLTCIQFSLLAIILVIASKEAINPTHFWSSYYKVAVEKYAGERYAVNVNGLTQQVIESVEQRKRVKPFYFIPYQQNKLTPLNRVLVIGAGTGGDVAIALAQGAKRVDAVEIDGRLIQLGKKLNPNHPYADPRVHIYINDGRAFLQQSKIKYDMIIFALTDALAMVPGQSSIRLENYLYTLEGIKTAKQHLTNEGMFVIYNYYAIRWIVDRLGNTITEAFGHAPCINTYKPQDYWATVLMVSQSSSALQCQTIWQPTQNTYVAPSTDNHPFLYLQTDQIPLSYIVALIFIFVVAFFSIKSTGVSFQVIRNNLDLFLMGAAFLLLETKYIINFALLFGTTWLVNSLVFVGILTTVYLSIELAHRFQFKQRSLSLYIILMGFLLLSWKIPTAFLLSLPVYIRFMLASVLAFSPILVANLIFSDRFRQRKISTEAFAVNLLGAVFGGLLEYTSLFMGYQNLLLLAIGLYLFALISTRGLSS